MCVCVYVCIYVCIRVCVCVRCMYVRVCIYVLECAGVYTLALACEGKCGGQRLTL